MDQPADRPHAARWCSFRWFALTLGVLLVLRFNKLFTGLEAFALRDFSMFSHPLAAHLQRSLMAGELPHWDVLTQCGTPFLAQWNTMTLYPPMWLAAMLPLSWSLSVFCVLHQFLGGLGAWRLAYRFTGDRSAAALAGLAYAGHGLVQSSLMWPNNSAALGWLPWVLLTVEIGCRQRGRAWFTATMIGALQMLTGGPEVILFTWLTAAGLVIVQAGHQTWDARERLRRLAALTGIVTVVALLAAAQLLPFARLLLESHREAGFAGDQWSVSPLAWANLVLPLFATIEHPGPIYYHQTQGWTHSYYAGITLLALAMTAPFVGRDRRLWIASGGCLLLLLTAMGAAGGIHPLIARVPPFHLLRFPVKFLIPLSLLLPLLGAIGFARLRRIDDASRRTCDPRRCGWMFALVALAWAAAFAVGLNNDRIARGDYVANSVTRLLLLALSAIAVIALARGRGGKVALPLTIGVITLDLLIQQPNLAPTIPSRNYEVAIPALEELRRELDRESSRAALSSLAIRELNAHSLASKADTLLLDRLALFGDCNLIDGLPKVNGFYSLYLRRYRQVQMAFHGQEDEPRRSLADFLGVSHVMRHAQMFQWTRRASAMPRVTGGQRPVFLNESEGRKHLAGAGFDPRTEVILPADVQDQAPEREAAVTISDVSLQPHRIRFVAEADRASVAVIAQAEYPAWEARLNGDPVPILRANHAFQAVALPAGRSEVVMEYHDRWFTTGWLISLLSFCFVLGGQRLARPRPTANTDPTAIQSR